MKKTIIFFCILICSNISFSQNDAHTWMQGMNGGLGIPMEFRDLKAVGLNLQVGFDFAYPINEKFAVGFYLSVEGGFLGELHPQYKYDNFYSMLQFSTGILMEIGELNKKPFILGVGPGTGMGLLDMDLILPIELRFGRVFSNRWYIMGAISYGVSLAGETVSLVPSVRVGYNFGHKVRERKK